MKDLISIVMPVKNSTEFLTDCLDSIVNQSEKNWELIAVDDHSIDNSLTLLRLYSNQDSRIKVFENSGDGIINALQLAYSKTSGAFIHRMDADDIMVKEKLEELKATLISHGKGFVATGLVKYFSATGVSDGYKSYETWINELCIHNSHWKDIYKECVIASPCWLIHRSDFDKCEGFNSLIYPEDYDLVFRFYKYGLQVASSRKVLHLWRDHEQRTSRNHEHYQQNAFFEIKLHYFFQLDYKEKRDLIIWGAGKKGKILAKLLNERKVDFQWVSNNPNKHGKEIYNIILESFKNIVKNNNPQILITVAQRDAKKEITAFLHELNLKEKEDYLFLR